MRCLLLPLFLGLSLNAADTPKTGQPLELVPTRLAWELHRAISPDTRENSFISPFSIVSCLGMVELAAKGQTLTELRQTLRHEMPAEQQHAAFGSASSALVERIRASGIELESARALCVQQAGQNAGYLESIRRDYGAEVFPADLAGINRWVAVKTKGQITSILDRFPQYPHCAVLDAVYFSAKWEAPFNSTETETADFHCETPGVNKVDMMQQSGRFPMATGDRFTRLRLPYAAKAGVFMEVLLPLEGQTLSDAEGATSPDDFNRLLNAPLSMTKVSVRMPRFKLEQSYDLGQPLQSLGVRTAFGGKADLSGLSGKPGDIHVDSVRHKTALTVDEGGTKADAATGVAAGRPIGAGPQGVFFNADRPFLLVIRTEDTILFIGRVAKPYIWRTRSVH